MAHAAKKSATRKTAARGSSGKKSASAQKKRQGSSRQPAFAAEPQRSIARKRGRPPGSGRKHRPCPKLDSIVTTQLEALNNKLQSVVGLRNDIHDLRDSIEVLSAAVDTLLKANRRSVETEISEPPDAV